MPRIDQSEYTHMNIIMISVGTMMISFIAMKRMISLSLDKIALKSLRRGAPPSEPTASCC